MKSRSSRHLSTALFARISGVATTLALAATAVVAQAEESAYCRKVHARASSDAALLLAPTLRAEALKLPSSLSGGARIDATPTGSSYQVRAGATVSLLNMYKGTRLPVVADADCAQHEATNAAQELLAQAEDFGRLEALRAEAKALDESRPEWERVAAKMTERFAAQNVTLLNVEDVHTRTVALERRRAQIGGEIGRIEASGLGTQRPNVAALAQNIDAAATKYERETSHVRSLDAFDLSLTGGYVPPVLDTKESDFFGVIQISYNLGGPFRNAAESRYRAARVRVQVGRHHRRAAARRGHRTGSVGQPGARSVRHHGPRGPERRAGEDAARATVEHGGCNCHHHDDDAPRGEVAERHHHDGRFRPPYPPNPRVEPT